MSAALATFALPAAALMTWALIRSSLGRRVVAEPRGDRWHEQKTPLLGGLGLFAGLLAGVGAALAADALEPSKELFGILGGCAIVFASGLADDLRALPPAAKLASQIGAAALVIATGLQVQIVGNDVLATAIALLWLVGMTNAFNLLDNMDGLAATMAAIACAYFAVDASTTHDNRLVLVLALAVGLACAGFLPFNLRPGKAAAFFASYLLFVHGTGSTYQKHIFVVTLPVLLAARFALFIPFGLYRGVWRYAGAREATATIMAVGLSGRA